MALVVDASVAIKWFVDEPGANRARGLWEKRAGLVAPDLLVPEVCSALWRKVRLGQAVPDQAAEATRRLRNALLDLRPTAALATRAMALDSSSISRFMTASISRWRKSSRTRWSQPTNDCWLGCPGQNWRRLPNHFEGRGRGARLGR